MATPKFHDFAKAEQTAFLALDAYEQYCTGRNSSGQLDVRHTELTIALLEARLAHELGTEAYRLKDQQGEALRSFLESEVVAARAVFAVVEADLPEVPQLAGTETSDLEAYISNFDARQTAADMVVTERKRIGVRLQRVLDVVDLALDRIAADRMAAGLPRPPRVTHEMTAGGLKRLSVPTSSADCDGLLATLQAQRVRPPLNGMTKTEVDLDNARRALANRLAQIEAAEEHTRQCEEKAAAF